MPGERFRELSFLWPTARVWSPQRTSPNPPRASQGALESSPRTGQDHPVIGCCPGCVPRAVRKFQEDALRTSPETLKGAAMAGPDAPVRIPAEKKEGPGDGWRAGWLVGRLQLASAGFGRWWLEVAGFGQQGLWLVVASFGRPASATNGHPNYSPGARRDFASISWLTSRCFPTARKNLHAKCIPTVPQNLDAR